MEEIELLQQLVAEYGDRSWARIASKMEKRCDVQCRYMYKRIINKKNIRGMRSENLNGQSKSENDFLDRINGLVIPENDQRYNQILKLTKQISYLDHNPLSMIQKTSTLNIKHEIYKILNSFT